MKLPTTKQYEQVLRLLSEPRLRVLQAIYHQPNSAATAPELAEIMGYRGFQGANIQVGSIGQIIYNETGVKPATYMHQGRERLRYYSLVGAYGELGWQLWPSLKKAMENLQIVGEPGGTYSTRLPTEIQPFEDKKFYEEGSVSEVFVNRFERDHRARTACIKHYGAKCQGCGFDFGEVYGSLAQGFIHVHHIVPLAEIGSRYSVNPIEDLIPLCANCHSVVHLSKPVLTLHELHKLIKKRAPKQSSEVDFEFDPRPLTHEDKRAISEYIAAAKAKNAA